MANIITAQQLQDASLDTQTLETFVNGDENTVNNPRLLPNVDVGSLAKLNKSVNDKVDLQIATLPVGHKGYATLAAAQAAQSSLPANSVVEVTNDGANNGTYQWNGSTLTKSTYDPLTQAKTYTNDKTAIIEAKINQMFAQNNAGPILQLYDAEYNVVAEIDYDSQLRLPDLSDSVQNEINQQKKTASHTADIYSFLHTFADVDGNIVGGIDKQGGLRLVGSTVPLQEKLNWQKVKLPARQFNERDLFTEAANKYILNMSVSGNQNAPIPFNLLPQNYTVPDSFVNNYSLNPPTEYTPINTPYGLDDRVVHPYVIEFAGNFRGFRYLMCITPYTAEYHENPVIMGSNNLQNWEMLTGFDQPIATPLPGRFLSDNGFAYDPTSGMLICYWRDGISNSSDDTNIYYRATRDGTEWTAPQLLFAADPTSSNLSPSVLFNPIDGLWHMWIGETSGWWRHYTSKTLNNNWELKSTRSFLDKGLWHSEVKFLGDKYVMLINKRDPGSNFYFAVSSNGDDWITGNYLFSTQQEALYKASFLPKFNDAGEMAFDIFYTTNHAEGSAWYRKFFHLTTNFAEI